MSCQHLKYIEPPVWMEAIFPPHCPVRPDVPTLRISLGDAFQARVLEEWLWTSMDQISADPICTTGNLRSFWAMGYGLCRESCTEFQLRGPTGC